jgi:branched-chain amino acid transport system permease protein
VAVRRQAALVGALIGAATIPLVAGDIALFQVTGVLVLAIALLGLNILVGYNGQISLGHGAFYALGAYVAALFVAHLALPHLAAIGLAAVVSLAAGFLFGMPAARLPAIHLAMATLALGAVLPNVVKHKALESWTGGSSGLALERREVPFGLPLSFDQWLYMLTLAVLVLLLVLASNLLRGRIGRAVIAIRDNPTAAQAFGVDATLYRSAIFGISAMYAGIAGALSALSVQYVAPGIYGVFLSFTLLAGIAIGGIGSLSGALYGALVLQGIQLLSAAGARSLGTAHVYALYGVLLLLVVYVAPRGIAGLFDRRAGYLKWY